METKRYCEECLRELDKDETDYCKNCLYQMAKCDEVKHGDEL